MDYVLMGAALLVAFANGANDNFKGFATVWGSDTLGYRRALALATAATVAGSLTSLFLAGELARQFSGVGLVPDAVASTPAFIFSVGTGAALTILAATRAGLPVSTTHALIGGLIGAALGQHGGELGYRTLAGSFLLPLLSSPLIAAALAALFHRLAPRRPPAGDCACVVPGAAGLASGEGLALARSAPPALLVAPAALCDALPRPLARISLGRAADHLHVLSAALICFARGVNDTPKMAALLMATQLLHASVSVPLIAAAMAAGGLIHARRVALTMSRRVTRLDPAQGLAANLVTAGLVLFASKLGVPVSTTHVAVGSIAGVGAGARTLQWATVRNIALSWCATLPLAGAIAWAAASLASGS